MKMVLFGHYISQVSPEKTDLMGMGERERERDVILYIIINI